MGFQIGYIAWEKRLGKGRKRSNSTPADERKGNFACWSGRPAGRVLARGREGSTNTSYLPAEPNW